MRLPITFLKSIVPRIDWFLFNIKIISPWKDHMICCRDFTWYTQVDDLRYCWCFPTKKPKFIYITIRWQRISLGNGEIHSIEKGAFNGLHKLTELALTSCSLSQMPPLDPIKRNLVHLNLRLNHSMEMAQSYFNGFSRLIRLDLGWNRLAIFPDISPLAQTLHTFKVPGNEITSISASITSSNFSALSILDIASNRFTRVNLEIISHWPILRYVDIAYNLIETLDDISDIPRKRDIEVGISIYCLIYMWSTACPNESWQNLELVWLRY